MRVKFSDPGATLPLYTRDPFEPVRINATVEQPIGAQRRVLHRGVSKPALSNKRSRILENGDFSSPLPATWLKEEESATGSRRRSTRTVGSQNTDGNESSPASHPRRQHQPFGFSGKGTLQHQIRSSTRHSDRLLDSSVKNTATGPPKYPIYSSPDAAPALVRFAEELPSQQQRITVEHVGDDHYLVTGTNWRWETSFPVNTSGDLRTLIQTFEGDTPTMSPSSQPLPHLTQGTAVAASVRESRSSSEELPDLTNGSSPPHQPSTSPPPPPPPPPRSTRSTPKLPVAPRPSSGRVLNPTAKLRELEAARHVKTSMSRERSSSPATDLALETRGSAVPESNVSGLKIQLKRTSPAPSGIKLSLKQNGVKAKDGHVVVHNGPAEDDDDDDEIVVGRPPKRARFGGD